MCNLFVSYGTRHMSHMTAKYLMSMKGGKNNCWFKGIKMTIDCMFVLLALGKFLILILYWKFVTKSTNKRILVEWGWTCGVEHRVEIYDQNTFCMPWLKYNVAGKIYYLIINQHFVSFFSNKRKYLCQNMPVQLLII